MIDKFLAWLFDIHVHEFSLWEKTGDIIKYEDRPIGYTQERRCKICGLYQMSRVVIDTRYS